MEEIYKVLRAGFAEKTFRMLVETGLLAAIAPEVPGRITDVLAVAFRDRQLSAGVQAQSRVAGNAILLDRC